MAVENEDRLALQNGRHSIVQIVQQQASLDAALVLVSKVRTRCKTRG
jgi:hypothetical protein